MKNKVKCPNCAAKLETSYSLQLECPVCGYMIEISNNSIEEDNVQESKLIPMNE